MTAKTDTRALTAGWYNHCIKRIGPRDFCNKMMWVGGSPNRERHEHFEMDQVTPHVCRALEEPPENIVVCHGPAKWMCDLGAGHLCGGGA